MEATTFLVLAGSVNRLVEVLKPALTNFSKKSGWSDGAYDALVQFISVLLGVLLAFVSGGANLLPAVLNIPAPVGIALTGVLIGLGADVVNAAVDFFYSWQRPAPTA